MEAIRVVLAEDSAAVRKSFRKLLEKENDIDLIAEAANGVEALSAVSTHHPQVLLLDIYMPLMNGFKVIQELKASHLPVRILVVSSYSEWQYISGVLQTGVSGYLVKDNAVQHLAEAIRKVAAGRKWIPGQPIIQSIPQDYQMGNVLVVSK